MPSSLKKILSILVFSSILFFTLAHVSSSVAVDLPQPALNHIPVCSVGNPQTPRCHARVVVDSKGKPQVTTSPSGYGPAQLLGAYSLTGFTSSTRIIAIVDAYDDPNILSDLNYYSTINSIPQMTACPVSSGINSAPCFQKVDQRGGTAYPNTDSGWALETSLDVETVHALCQNCNILLVEADSSSYANLMAAVDRAVAMGANVISNSYGSSEFRGETTYDYHFNIPNVAITFSSGDSGYGATYPAASRYVKAVGGTTLNLSGNSYVSETVWSGTGSGCSAYEIKPVWQKDTGCRNRMIADISADANPNTGASVYDTVPYSGQTGWFQVGGTSLASPIIAAVYALAGDSITVSSPSSLPYLKGNSANLHDVTFGTNGRCKGKPSYLCTAGIGYDGPTGLGTPNGPSAF